MAKCSKCGREFVPSDFKKPFKGEGNFSYVKITDVNGRLVATIPYNKDWEARRDCVLNALNQACEVNDDSH